MKNYLLSLFIFFLISNILFCQNKNETNDTINSIEYKCDVNLDCAYTFCCKEEKCVDFSFCKYENFTVYITIGLIACGIIGLSLTFYFISRKKTILAMKRLLEKGIIKHEEINDINYLNLIENNKDNGFNRNNNEMNLEIVKENN
jgi:hypothetical protein